jgi:hypothetical protein
MLDDGPKRRIDSRTAEPEEEMKGIGAKTEELGTEIGKLFGAARTGAAGASATQTAHAGDADVVDHEFEDVSDEPNKR